MGLSTCAKVVFLISSIGFICVGVSDAQVKGLCDCWNLEKTESASEMIKCSDKDLSESETLKVMECLIKRKGDRSPYWGVATSNKVSQTFGPSPMEVIALFQISYLFYGNNDFASAMVLIENDKDNKFNSKKSIDWAFTSYRNWLKKIRQIGLGEARKQKLDPLNGSKIRWY